jgi:membrane-associated protease RseP (regulator of RpoE activity)
MTPLLNIIFSFTLALILHELGHLTAARLCGVPVRALSLGWGPRLYSKSLNNINCQLRLLPIGAFVQMDMGVFRTRSLNKQLLVLGAGIGVNLVLGLLTWGTLFGVLNLGLAIGNSLPVYQQDGWKSAIVVSRRLLGRSSALVEWTITIVGGAMALAVIVRALFAVS